MTRPRLVRRRPGIRLREWGLAGALAALSASWVLAGGPAAAASPAARQLAVFAGTGTSGPVTPGPATKSDLYQPFSGATNSLGDVFIADGSNNEVDEVSSSGIISVVAGTGKQGKATPGPATHSDLHFPDGVAVDGLGDLFIADAGNNEVEEVTPAGILSVVAGTGALGTPTPGPADRSELGYPYGVAVDGLGNLYIADAKNNVVEKVTPAGTLSVFAGTGTGGAPVGGPATHSDLSFPTGLALDGFGNLYIADTLNSDVEEVTPTGTLSIIAGKGTAGRPTPGPAKSSALNHPYGVGVDTSGDVYIADTFNAEIEEITPAKTLSIIAGTGTTGAPTPGPATSSKLDQPSGVVADGLGVLYVANYGGNEVDRITAPQGGAATVGISAPASGGFVQATASGHVHADGTAFLGSPYASGVASPVAGLSATSKGDYLLATARGKIYAYGTALHGSPTSLTSPVVGIATTASGYVVATGAGAVHVYGTPSHGSPAGDHLTSAVAGITTTSAGGYLVATSAGSVYAFDATSHGSPKSHGVALPAPVVGIAATSGGYVVATATGNVYNYGTPFHGSPAASHATLTAPVTGISATSGGGYVLTTSAGTVYSYAS